MQNLKFKERWNEKMNEELELENEQRNKLRAYIYGDYHRLEDFTDLEICSENDLTKAEDITDKLLYNIITSVDIVKMYKELESRNIDLVKWGALYNNGNIERRKDNEQ
jgi:hypothetical protein